MGSCNEILVVPTVTALYLKYVWRPWLVDLVKLGYSFKCTSAWVYESDL